MSRGFGGRKLGQFVTPERVVTTAGKEERARRLQGIEDMNREDRDRLTVQRWLSDEARRLRERRLRRKNKQG